MNNKNLNSKIPTECLMSLIDMIDLIYIFNHIYFNIKKKIKLCDSIEV